MRHAARQDRALLTDAAQPALTLDSATRDRLLGHIGLSEVPAADAAGLRTVHRAFVSRVPYEDLAVQLGESEPLEPGALVRRVVDGSRGGYCFEANTVLHTLLTTVGFEVERREGIVGARDGRSHELAAPHPEVPDALARLRDTPLKIVSLTNSTQGVAEAQLRNAAIRDHFDGLISADSVGALKPAPAPYIAVADAFGVAIDQVRLVAAHSWDVSGALAAGAKAAFVGGLAKCRFES